MSNHKNRKFNPVWVRPLGLALAVMLAFSSCAGAPASQGRPSYSSGSFNNHIWLEQFQSRSTIVTAALDYYFKDGKQKADLKKRYDRIQKDFFKAFRSKGIDREDRIMEQMNKLGALHNEVLMITGPIYVLIINGKIVKDYMVRTR